MADNPYSLLQNTKYKRYDDRGHITPNFEYSEGIRPAGSFMPAEYLPSVRFNVYFEEHVVLSGGKIVAFDSNGAIVPAGLRADLAAETALAGDGLIRYTQIDVDRGVLNASGNLVALDERVAASMIVETMGVSNPIGLSSYNYWTHPGGNGENPAQFNVQNFSLQNKVAFVTDYVVQVPIVVDDATYLAAPYAGMGALVLNGAALSPGMFVSSDINSNFQSIGYDIADTGQVIGQVLAVSGLEIVDYLDKVRTQYNHPDFDVLEQMPGSASEGQPDSIVYSGGQGLVTINLINR